MRHQVFAFSLRQTLSYGTLYTHQTSTELVFSQLSDTAHPAITQVVNIINLANAITQIDQYLDGVHDVFISQGHWTRGVLTPPEAAIDLHPPNARKVVGLFTVKETVEQVLDSLLGRRLTRTHHAIDGNTGCHLIGSIINTQGLGNIPPMIKLIDVQVFELTHSRSTHFHEHGLGDFIIGTGNQLAGVQIDNVLGYGTANNKIIRNRDPVYLGLLQLTDVTGIDTLVFFDNDITFLVLDIKACHFTTPVLGNKLQAGAIVEQLKMVKLKEMGQNRLGVHANRLEQDSHGHLATTIDTEKEVVTRIKLEIQPGTTIRNDPGRKQQLS